MKNKIPYFLIYIVMFCFLSVNASAGKRVEDRDTICSLMFGVYDDQNRFVKSTAMQDACTSANYETRKRICEFNYKQAEIINACISTYEAVTHKISEAKAYNKSKQQGPAGGTR